MAIPTNFSSIRFAKEKSSAKFKRNVSKIHTALKNDNKKAPAVIRFLDAAGAYPEFQLAFALV